MRYIASFLSKMLPPTRLLGLHNLIWRFAGVKIHRSARICGYTRIMGRGSIIIGEGTWISPGSTFLTNTECEIIIGSNCDIGPDVIVVTGSHDIGSPQRRAGLGTAESVSIGNGTWIGARSTILPGTFIGSGVVVAAGSLIRNEIPENVLVAGVPAMIKRLIEE